MGDGGGRRGGGRVGHSGVGLGGGRGDGGRHVRHGGGSGTGNGGGRRGGVTFKTRLRGRDAAQGLQQGWSRQPSVHPLLLRSMWWSWCWWTCR